MLDSRICMEFLPRSILSLHDLRQSQSPEMQGVRLALGPLRYLKPRMGPFFQSEWPLWWVLGFEISMQEPLSQSTILLKLTWVGVEFQKSNEPSVWHKLWSFLWLLVQVWDNLRANFWQFSNGSQFFFFELMVVKAWSCGFVQLLGCSVRQFTISLHTFLCMTLHIMGPWRCLRPVSLSHVLFLLLLHRSWIRTYFVIVDNIFTCFAFPLSARQADVVKKWCWFSQIDFFHNTFHIGSMFCFSTYTDKNSPLPRLTNEHSQFGTFSQPCSERTFSNCRSQK